jgi:hypothetical protein
MIFAAGKSVRSRALTIGLRSRAPTSFICSSLWRLDVNDDGSNGSKSEELSMAILVLVGFEISTGSSCGRVAKRRSIFQPGKRGSDLLWRLGEMERRYESGRGCRGSSGLNPLIVVRRKVQQPSLGKLVCVLRKAATTLGIRLQEVNIRGHPPLNNAFNFARPVRLIYRLRKDFVWAVDKRDGYHLGARSVRQFYLVTLLRGDEPTDWLGWPRPLPHSIQDQRQTRQECEAIRHEFHKASAGQDRPNPAIPTNARSR